MITMRVSTKEEEMILNERARLEKISFARGYRAKVLKVAHGYRGWLDKHGRGSSFSTFVNEFGYQGRDSTQVFHAVQRLFAVADEIADI